MVLHGENSYRRCGAQDGWEWKEHENRIEKEVDDAVFLEIISLLPFPVERQAGWNSNFEKKKLVHFLIFT